MPRLLDVVEVSNPNRICCQQPFGLLAESGQFSPVTVMERSICGESLRIHHFDGPLLRGILLGFSLVPAIGKGAMKGRAVAAIWSIFLHGDIRDPGNNDTDPKRGGHHPTAPSERGGAGEPEADNAGVKCSSTTRGKGCCRHGDLRPAWSERFPSGLSSWGTTAVRAINMLVDYIAVIILSGTRQGGRRISGRDSSRPRIPHDRGHHHLRRPDLDHGAIYPVEARMSPS
jgi:hypothetical protein